MTRTLAGLPWHAYSPSLFELAGLQATPGQLQRQVTLAFDGRSWLIGIDGIYGTRQFPTRDDAAALVASAFTTARENLA